MDQPPAPPVDNRMEFLGTYVQKSLKLKAEKWSRMIATEEHKAMVMKFLERPLPIVLVIILTPSAQLVPSNGFPLVQLKSKGVYFIKKDPAPVCKAVPAESVIVGDLSPKLIDQLASLVDEILVPLLSNSKNHGKWPAVIAKDVHKHVHSLRSTVYQVKGQVNGQTVLPMPVGVERVFEVEKTLTDSKGEICDLYLKSGIEGVVMKWASQINDVLANDSSEKTVNPIPSVEIQFWCLRLRNLQYIYEQLKESRVRSMAAILEKTNSAYYACFKNLFKNVVVALAEAKDIYLHLTPLKKHVTLLEETDFSECIPLLAPVMHVVCLIWATCESYDQVKLITLLKQICNLLILEAKKFLDPTTLFHSDIDEAMQRVGLCINTLKQFMSLFKIYKLNLARFFKDKEPNLWNFDANMVFERFTAFVERLQTIQWFFNTVLEFSKLEKVEIGGIKGRILSSRVTTVFSEFQQCYSTFSGKSYDVLDPDDPSFVEDFEIFKQRIFEMDMKLSAILCQAFEDCSNLDSIFKLINISGCLLERPFIKEEFTKKYVLIVDMLEIEAKMIEGFYDEQMTNKRKYGEFIVDKYVPPVTGTLRWTKNLEERIMSVKKKFESFQHPITKNSKYLEIMRKFDVLLSKISAVAQEALVDWAKEIPSQIEESLKLCLLIQNPKTKELFLNFNPHLSAILREVHYLNLMQVPDIPEIALKLAEKNDTFRKYISNLNSTIAWYNNTRKTTKNVEFDLIKIEIDEIDKRIYLGQNSLSWNSDDLWDYITNLHSLVKKLQDNLTKCQENLNQIKTVLIPFARKPLFERKDGKKDACLCIEDREERIARQHSEISNATETIMDLLNSNKELFGMSGQPDRKEWINYIDFVDKIVLNYLYQSVGCSLGYINEHMDSSNNLAPLFESQLLLKEPDIVFVPSLEMNDSKGFHALINGLINDIVETSSIVPRLSVTIDESYMDEIKRHQDIIDIKADILLNVEKVLEEAFEFCHGFRSYSYLWLDDRDEYLKQILNYGRQLTNEELDLIAMKDAFAPKMCPPKMETFREQIDNFETLFCEVEQIQEKEIFSAWFQVDIKPFKQALLNTIRKWGDMFNQYLVNTVTNSLCDLGQFIRKADEGLQQCVQEGDYQALVNVMGFLLHVKERQATTDEMFIPLRETIELLKFYDQDIPEEVNVYLQELPEQWNNTKKIAITVKQQLAPLQAAEVTCIRKKVQEFDSKILLYREVFKKYLFFRYVCPDPYGMIDKVDKDLGKLENEMRSIHESGSLFEVNVPDFKVLKQCRRDLRLLKQLWDYAFIVHTCVDDWKTTPWRKIDVENMDIECKKFAKEIRMLDKEMRGWDTYSGLESTVKNTLTSLKAVGELQNPAIRERHWDQLMVSTKNLAALPQEFKVS